MTTKKDCIALVVAAGTGKRMQSHTQKQYMDLLGKPLLTYCLETLQNSDLIDEIVLVVGKEDIPYVKDQIVAPFGLTKVCQVVPGGKERYDSVWQGLQAIDHADGYVFIHDGARPFLTEDILRRGYETVLQCPACVAGMPSKDTVKMVDENATVMQTPDRGTIWTVQTPQVFALSLIREAYERLMQQADRDVTDDAMVVEKMLKIPVKLFCGSYENFKITTPEDLLLAEGYLSEKGKSKKAYD